MFRYGFGSCTFRLSDVFLVATSLPHTPICQRRVPLFLLAPSFPWFHSLSKPLDHISLRSCGGLGAASHIWSTAGCTPWLFSCNLLLSGRGRIAWRRGTAMSLMVLILFCCSCCLAFSMLPFTFYSSNWRWCLPVNSTSTAHSMPWKAGRHWNNPTLVACWCLSVFCNLGENVFCLPTGMLCLYLWVGFTSPLYTPYFKELNSHFFSYDKNVSSSVFRNTVSH